MACWGFRASLLHPWEHWGGQSKSRHKELRGWGRRCSESSLPPWLQLSHLGALRWEALTKGSEAGLGVGLGAGGWSEPFQSKPSFRRAASSLAMHLFKGIL